MNEIEALDQRGQSDACIGYAESRERCNEIELLAPARDLLTGREAILHGADAVYIGAPRFGARAAAGNSVEDIAELVGFAHPYGVKVYVTLNTILYDDELEEARRLAWELYRVGVDALIVQDLRFVRDLSLPPIPLHASTQMDNRTAEKVAWLSSLGFKQAVLARELTLDEVRAIHQQVPQIALEVFVHGAICVCYNGRCFASEHCFGRSANRGECAQFCRLPFDLIEESAKRQTPPLPLSPRPGLRPPRPLEGWGVGRGAERVLLKQKHLLSLRDMNRSDDLEVLLDAGARSLKIEGRLKDVSYVKNVVAYYRRRLDEIFRRRPDDYRRSSLGHETITFVPNPSKSFNRLFTDYFLHGRTASMANIHTPKSMGERVGPQTELHNGDGLCFLNDKGELEGFRIGNVMKEIPPYGRIREGLYRNYDHDFEQLLSKPTATRKIGVRWLLKDVAEGFSLRLTREDGAVVEQVFPCTHELARSPQAEQIEQQLSRLGDTPYEAVSVEVELSANWFIPRSVLANWRRTLTDLLLQQVTPQTMAPVIATRISDDDIERQRHPDEKGLLMTCRYCIRYELGMCSRTSAVPEPLFLRLADGRRFRLQFDCKQCQMKVYADKD